MTLKKLCFSTIAGLLGHLVAYFILEEVILKSFMENTVYKPMGASVEGVITPLIAAVLMMFIMAYMYPKGYEGGPPVLEGLRFGILMGLFLGIPIGIFFDVMFHIGLVPVVVLIMVSTLEIMVPGILIAIVYGELKPLEQKT